MLQLLLGRGDRDRTGPIYARMTRPHGEGDYRCLIVPEQASHEAERALCAAGGDKTSTYAEVLSFTRLASRVFAQVGGGALPTLDAGGRILLLCAALKEVATQLSVYAKPSRKPAFLTQMLATLDELKSCCITPKALALAGEETDKLKDLALIYGAYDALTQQVAADPRDRLTRLAAALQDNGWAEGKEFFLAGFTDFTPQERQVIAALLEGGAQVTVSLLCDHLNGEDPLFEPTRRTCRQLVELARRSGGESKVEYLTNQRAMPPELAHLEAQLFSDKPTPWPETPEGIALYRADTPRSEVEWAAACLRRFAMEGMRFREMAVTARDFEPYRPLVESIFPQYGLPVFTSAMTDILEQPALAVVASALDVLEGGWQREDVFRYLKTGLTHLEEDEVDRLENYAETWDIRGSKWTAPKPWTQRPDGQFGVADAEESEKLILLNALREKVTAPLLALKKRGGETGRNRAEALYQFLEEIALPRRLEERSKALQAAQRPQKAEEYRQLWDILCGALDQCAVILEQTPMELDEFGRVLKLVLTQYDVGAIPVSLDRVTAGDLPRLSGKVCRVLCLLGGEDGQIPQVSPAAGLLNEEDRELLAQQGLETAPGIRDKLTREWTILYEGCLQGTQRLLVFYPARGGDGSERRPSVLVSRLKKAFPQMALRQEGEEAFRLTAPIPAMESGQAKIWPLLEGIPACAVGLERMRRAEGLTRGSLSPAAVDALYGDRVPMSASRLDKYQSCRFSYFLQYGLKAKARKRAGFAAPEYGTFVHYVLEYVLKQGGQALETQERKALISKGVEDYVARELGGLEYQSQRFCYLFRRLLKTVTAVVENACAELAAGDFTPISFELGFGGKGTLPAVDFHAGDRTVSLSGFVDRVDGWEKDGRLYLRVVDYKTGRKSFDWSDIWNGLGLQMLVYLNTLEREGKTLYGKEIVPAGVLYLPARDAVISGPATMARAAIQTELDKALRRKGVLLDNPDVLAAMERTEGEEYRYLPLKVSAKTGQITGEALVSAEGLGKLAGHVDKVLARLTRELTGGAITADPYWRGAQKNACLYCEYAAACQFREGVGGDCRRPMASMKQADFWSALEGEGGETHGISTD